jgi:hypothetical protein
MEHNRKCLSLQHQPGPSDKPRKELSVLDSFPKRLVYYLMNRSRSLYSYAKNILEDIGYKVPFDSAKIWSFSPKSKK